MKKFWLMAFLALFMSAPANAVNMVQIQSYLNVPVRIIGLPDFPPFAYYTASKDEYKFHSIFLNPVIDILQKYNVETEALNVSKDIINNPSNVKLMLVEVKSGEVEMFIGAYSDTKLFSGLEIIYPAVISNPIHLIAQSEISEKVKHYGDLKNLKGIASKTEYFSDFVLRKFKELNITYVDSPFEAYEMIITGKADYMLGSLYYNRIMASRHGVGDYLTYSKNPIFKIPFFVSLSKIMPVMSEYKRVLHEEFQKPEFAQKIKQQILDVVNEEVDKNAGVVPPSFVKKIEQPQNFDEDEEFEEESVNSGGHIVEQKVHQKTIDEVLDGL